MRGEEKRRQKGHSLLDPSFHSHLFPCFLPSLSWAPEGAHALMVCEMVLGVVLGTKSSWKVWCSWDNPRKTFEMGAGENGTPEGHPSTKEGR